MAEEQKKEVIGNAVSDCKDLKCPVHGSVKVRGNMFEGIAIRAKAPKTVIVERYLMQHVRKYERYKKVRSRITAHKPDCIQVAIGDKVRIGETRKLSKTKSFVVMEVLK
ncbi:MAG: 30S ribosomal protein S17 [Candidatus Diapherotrites archaeon]|nr:30S ribosomal protein S17 [Candidatus Diapherotrites archaeon]